MNTHLVIKVRELLSFFDIRSRDSRGHVSAISGVIGEDLGVALLQRCLRKQRKVSSRVILNNGSPMTPTNGTGRGPWLDRWLLADTTPTHRTLYQVEIKNWSTTTKGGRELRLDADEGVLRQHRRERWLAHWDDDQKCFRYPNVRKVLDRMSIPKYMDNKAGRSITISPAVQQEDVEPMLCFWFAVHPRGENESLYTYRLPSAVNGFNRIWVFSMSNYLRSLRETEIELEMPSAARRIGWLQHLFRRDHDESNM